MSVLKIVNRAARPVIQALPSPRKPVFLLGHDRSGSTWIGRTLGLSKESVYLHEPLNERASSLGNWNLYLQYVAPGERNEALERVFGSAVKGVGVRDLTKREIANMLTLRSTVIIKETGGMLSGEWFQKIYRARILMLTRHPAPVILSNIKMAGHNAGFWLEKLLGQKAMIREFCPEMDLRALAGPDDDLVSKFAVVYCIRYLVAFSQLARNPDWIHLKYEEFCEEPVMRFRALYQTLGLDFTAAIEEAVVKSCSVDGSDAFFGTKRVSRDHLTKWFGQLDDGEKRKIRRILDAFDFPIYRDDADWQLPDPETGR